MISLTIEYALRALAHLASLPPDAGMNSESIARVTGVPKGYLSKIMRDLVLARLVNSQRGPNGGFTISRAPGEISVLEVVNAVDPIKRITKCPLDRPDHANLCPLHRRLDDAIALIEARFAETTVAELLDAPGESSSGASPFLPAPCAEKNGSCGDCPGPGRAGPDGPTAKQS
ncbi:MAG: Rrf2 family transcriptional regulator [Phycisphaerales bacterium]|nr:Rrf2 family transcriptional regulator [Phycisphaerales bacterium]